MSKLKYLSLFIIFLFSALPIFAKDWQVVFYGESSDTTVYDASLFVLKSDGSVQQIQLPPALGIVGDHHTLEIIVSDDLRYVALAILNLDGNPLGAELRVADLQSGLCCADISGQWGGFEAIDLGAFEPGGSQFSFSYVIPSADPNQYVDGGMAIVDAEHGLTISGFTTEELIATTVIAPYSAWVHPAAWTTDGIYFYGDCYGCEGTIEGEYALYDPASAVFTTSSGVPFSMWGDYLDGTGELIYILQNQNYPYDPTENFFPSPNVVTYSAAGVIDDPNAQTIYADPSNINLKQARWVADGDVLMIEPAGNNNFYDILYRGGIVHRMTGAYDTRYIGPSLSGWFMLHSPANDNQTLSHVDLATLQSTNRLVIPANFNLMLVEAPAQGFALANVTGFPDVAPGANPTTPQVITCPGFLPSRLVINERGRVTPGAANNMRSDAYLTSAKIGEIPGGGEFRVIAGPICEASTSLAWWQVNYNGLIGWTAEGKDGSYWIEPLGP
ncbi:hypothetical protein MASR2M15_19810 [Anaerolineales bacterium]